MSTWATLLNTNRRRRGGNNPDPRTQIERDFDRILYASPTRRMADKTQVFPMDANDSVRTRLTHSHEVANLARSIGNTLLYEHHLAADTPNAAREIPALLATIGLAHDMGNPPFGHEGEAAIAAWFKQRSILEDTKLSEAQKQDFYKFEGNAQGFRLVTTLQRINDDYGLNLTYATLAAMVKYPCTADVADKESNNALFKKHNFFLSEATVFEEIWQACKLQPNQRHPLNYIMEACDDICYSVLDVEDGVKKQLVSFHDVMLALRTTNPSDAFTESLVQAVLDKHNEYRQGNLSPTQLNDVSMQAFRIHTIGLLADSITHCFLENLDDILAGKLTDDLLAKSEASAFIKALKKFNFVHIYRHKSVVEVELTGYQVIFDLMDILWAAIDDMNDEHKSKTNNSFHQYDFERISENYRQVYAHSIMPEAYKKAQLLTDMISGMTDSYAVNLRDELLQLKP